MVNLKKKKNSIEFDDYGEFGSWSMNDKITEAWLNSRGEFSLLHDESGVHYEFCEGDDLGT